LNKLVEEIIKPILESNSDIKKVVGIFGGRFQPFGPHHKKVYEWLKSQFDDAYITTSNIKKLPRHPMNFKEKVRHMTKMGIPKSKIIQEKSPFVAKNLSKKFDEKTTAFVYIFGKKDTGRLGGGKYFQDYKKNKNNLKGHEEHGYYLVAPHMSVSAGGLEVSGTAMRELLGSEKYKENREKLFKKMFGYYDKGVFNMMTNKFSKIFENDMLIIPWDNTKPKPKNPKLFDKKKRDLLFDLDLPIKVGDVVKMGRFKNKKVTIKSIDYNDKGDLMINGRPALKFRIVKKDVEEMVVKTKDGYRKYIAPKDSDFKEPYKQKDIDEFLIYNDIRKIIKEITAGAVVGQDDGPSAFIGGTGGYVGRNKREAEKLGWGVLNYILNVDVEKVPPFKSEFPGGYPDGPHKSVTYMPAGIGTGATPNNQENLTGVRGFNKWKKAMRSVAQTVGMELIKFKQQKDEEKEQKKIVAKDSRETLKQQKKDEKEKEIEIKDVQVEENVFTKKWWFSLLKEEEDVMDKTIKYKDKEGNEKEATIGGILKKGEDHPAHKKAKQMVDKGKGKKSVKKTTIDTNPFGKEEPSDKKELKQHKTENGSQLIGVKHGQSVEQIIDGIKKDIKPNEKVTFVAEGGYIEDGKVKGLDGEQKEIAQGLVDYLGDNLEIVSMEEGADVYDNNSPVYKHIEKQGNLSQEQSMAAIWSNMVGQDKEESDMDADDYLTPEGVDWLKGEAEKANMKFSADFPNKISKEDYDILYKLNYGPEDKDGTTETEVSKAQEHYNEFRQKTVVNKINKSESDGRKAVVTPGESHVKPIQKLLDKSTNESTFTKDWWRDLLIENIVTKTQLKPRGKELLLMGGAYGHMAHPFDDKELTFGDLKKIITDGLGGQLNREDNVTEKLDGQNIMISWKDGKLIAARNKGHIKNGGKNALTKSGIKSKFAGRGNIANAFNFAMTDLEKAIGSLSEKQKIKIFNNGYNFMNLEVMWPESANVIDYDVAELIFHGALIYDDKGNVKGEVPGSARMLAGMIKQVNQHIGKKYSISKPVFLTIPKNQDFGKKKDKFLGKLSKLQSKFGLSDSDTLGLYHQKWWEQFILKQLKKISPKVLKGLVKRWAFFDKSYKIPQIKKDLKDTPIFLEWVLKTDKENHTKIVKENMKPFEELFFEVGAEILKNVQGFMAANPKKAVQNIRKKLSSAISKVQSGGDLKKLKVLKQQLDKLNTIGGTKAIVPSEGIVFKYKGKTYKFTGAFAPINQITGLIYF